MKDDRASDGEFHLCPTSTSGVPSDRPHSFIRGSHNTPWPLLTLLSLASNVKLVTSAMTKIGQVSWVQHIHKLRSRHRQWQKGVPHVCPSFLSSCYASHVAITYLFVCYWDCDCLTWVVSIYAAASTSLITTSTPTPAVAPLGWSGLPVSQNAYVFPHETFGREFSSLS
jgi:hypothetical protein